MGVTLNALAKLFAWLSPGYPVGAFSYSHGLEWAVAAGEVTDAATLSEWVADVLEHGAARTDAILLAHAYRAAREPGALQEIADLAAALAPSVERLLETEQQGIALAETTAAAWGESVLRAPYPVALGQAAAPHGAPLPETATLYLQAFASNLVSAGVRLIPIGQTDGQRVIAALSPLYRQIAKTTLDASLDDIGGCAIRIDIASMRHETQPVRLFRS